MRSYSLVMSLLSFMVAGPSSALPVVAEFRAIVTSSSDGLGVFGQTGVGVYDGMLATATMVYDTDLAPGGVACGVDTCFDAATPDWITQVSLTVNGITFSSFDAGTTEFQAIAVGNDIADVGDRFSVQTGADFSFTGTRPGSTLFSFFANDSSSSMFSAQSALPTTAALFGENPGDGGGLFEVVEFETESLVKTTISVAVGAAHFQSFTLVPEPAVGWLLGLGIGAMTLHRSFAGRDRILRSAGG